MRGRVRIDGFDALERKLARLANSVPERIQRKALEEAGEIVAEEARRLVPVGKGTLRDSITVSDQRLGGAFKMDRALEGGGLRVFIGPRTRSGPPDGFYGHMVEFGTVHMAPQPFLRPAFDSTRGAVQTRLGDDVRAAVLGALRG